MMTRLVIAFILWQVLFISFLIHYNQTVFLINFELAFLASALILFASYQGYCSMVQRAIENDMLLESKNPLDVIEDPYDLYDEDDEELSEEELKERAKKIKKDGLNKMVKTKAGHASWKRVLAYGFLVLVFMGLNNNGMLSIAPFLIGLTVGLIFTGLVGKRILSSKI